jgi:cyanophycinase
MVIQPGIITLIGGGEFGPDCSFDEWLLGKIKPSVITLLPTAAAYQSPTLAIDNARSYFRNLGFDVEPVEIYERKHSDDQILVEPLQKAEFIYMTGGSPLHLRSVLKASLAYRTIVSKVLAGTSIAASSAAAMVLGEPMIDPRGGAFTLGLGLVPHLAVMPHANTWHSEKHRRTLELASESFYLAAIDEQSALIRLPDGTVTAMGSGKVAVYRGNTEIDLSTVRLELTSESA